MSKVKIQKVLKKMGTSDPLQSSFMNQLDEKIIKGKIFRLKKEIELFMNIDNKLLEFFYITIVHIKSDANIQVEINEKLLNEAKLLFAMDENACYPLLKKSNIMRLIVKTCENLIPHKEQLNNKLALSSNFIINHPGFEFNLLPNCNINFKSIFIDENVLEKEKEYVLVSLHLLYKLSYIIYSILAEPDVDIKEFVKSVVQALTELEKRIPRCEKAFKKIRDSIDMMKDNFSGYYKDFVSTGNQSIIMTDFLADLIKKNKTDFQLVRQFKEIMSYLNKAYQSAPKKNKDIDKLLGDLNKFSDVIEKHKDYKESEEKEKKEENKKEKVVKKNTKSGMTVPDEFKSTDEVIDKDELEVKVNNDFNEIFTTITDSFGNFGEFDNEINVDNSDNLEKNEDNSSEASSSNSI